MASTVSAGISKAVVPRAVELVSFLPQERELPLEVPVSQIMVATEALEVQVHAISNEFQTLLLPQLQQEIVKLAHLMSHERIQECVVEQPVDVPLSPVVLPIKAEIADAVQQPSPQGHIPVRIVKQWVDISVLLAMEDFVA